MEGCATERNMSAFELKKGVNLQDLPPFPLEEFTTAMTPRERQNIMAVYMAKAVDFIQGRKEGEDVYPRTASKRPLPYSSGSQTSPENSPSNSVLPGANGNETLQDRETREGTPLGFLGVAGGTEEAAD